MQGLVNGLLGQERDKKPVLVDRKIVLQVGHPVLLHRRRTDGNENVGGVRLEPEGQFHGVAKIPLDGDTGYDSAAMFLNGMNVYGSENNRDALKQIFSLFQKVERHGTDRNDQVDLPIRIFCT